MPSELGINQPDSGLGLSQFQHVSLSNKVVSEVVPSVPVFAPTPPGTSGAVAASTEMFVTASSNPACFGNQGRVQGSASETGSGFRV